MKVAIRAVLAVALLAGVYVLAATIALGMVWLGFWYRTLYLGAPLLLGFTRQHLRAVLAHELGH